MNGVIYARYSSDNQREESIEGQLRECKEFAEKNGITIVATYIDRALSAKTDNRPEFQRMIKESSKHFFDVVIVWKLDRFARNRYDSANYKTILRKNGVKVVSATERISEGAEGILLESLLEGMAEYYSAELSEKVTRGLTENALKCKQNGGTVPMGYMIDENKHYQLDPITAPIVHSIFEEYANGIPVLEIIEKLDKMGVKTCRGNKLNYNIMNRLLNNRKYMGEFYFGEIVVPNGIPVIVTPELFDRAQKQLDKNKHAPAAKKAEELYLLTTKLFCGKDGVFMVSDSGTSKTGKVHKYYRCVNSKKKKCSKKPVKKDWIEDLVIRETLGLLYKDEIVDYLVDLAYEKQNEQSTALPLLKKQLADTEKAIENMLNAIQQGILNESTKKRFDELENTKSKIVFEILQEEIKKPILTKEQMKFFIHKFREMDVTDPLKRQQIVDRFVNSIYLYDDKIVITFNYKDGTKTLTLKDIESSDLYPFPPPNNKNCTL